MKRKIAWGALVIIIGASLVITTLIGTVIYEQYQDTKQWSQSPFVDEIHNVPPAFASNYIPLGDKLSLEILTQVNGAINEIADAKGIPEGKISSYSQLYRKAMTLQDEQGLQDTDVMQNTYRLGLYIDIENAMRTAYTQPNSEPLKVLSSQLTQLMLNETLPIDTLYTERLSTIASDYGNLQAFSDKALSTLGLKDGSTLIVDVSVTYDMGHSLIKEIDASGLGQFDHVSKLKNLLEGDQWSSITKRNALTRKFYAWDTSRAILETLSKSDYISIASLYTYSKALDYDPSIELTPQEGTIIDPNSAITQIRMANRVLTPNEYVRRGTQLTFTIEPEYILIAKPELPDIPDEPEIPDNPPSQSTQQGESTEGTIPDNDGEDITP